MPRQLSFDLTRRPALERGDFFVSPANAAAVAAIEGWAGWPSGKLVLTGPAASGKTHLVHVWAALAGARIVPAATLAKADIPGLAAGPVAVEDVPHIAGDAAAEQALFHLHNLALAQGQPLLLTARMPPRDWPLGLPDLASRMQAAATAALHPPDDALLSAVLVKHLAERELGIPPGVLSYAVQRMDRSFAAAAGLAAALNRAAIARRTSGVTRPMVRAALEAGLDNAPDAAP